MGEKQGSGNFADKASHSCSVGFFYMLKNDMGLMALLPSVRSTCYRFFITHQNLPSSARPEPARVGPMASMPTNH
jgi:hypothetical protein